MVHHGIPCYEMQLGDVCLPPNHPDAINCDDSVVFDTFRRYTLLCGLALCNEETAAIINIFLITTYKMTICKQCERGR